MLQKQQVLTDYEGLARVVPNLAENSLVEGPAPRQWHLLVSLRPSISLSVDLST